MNDKTLSEIQRGLDEAADQFKRDMAELRRRSFHNLRTSKLYAETTGLLRYQSAPVTVEAQAVNDIQRLLDGYRDKMDPHAFDSVLCFVKAHYLG